MLKAFLHVHLSSFLGGLYIRTLAVLALEQLKPLFDLGKEKLSIFCRAHEQIKLVMENGA